MKSIIGSAFAVLAFAVTLRAQGDEPRDKPSFATAAAAIKQDLEKATAELVALRATITEEKVPMHRELKRAQEELAALRKTYNDRVKVRDEGNLAASNLRADVQKAEASFVYIAGLLGDYGREFESRLHVSELRRHAEVVESARLAPDDDAANQTTKFERQLDLVDASIERIEGALDGSRFEGKAAGESGVLQDGTFLVVGPVAIFAAKDGSSVGLIESKINSLEPTAFAFPESVDAPSVAALVMTGEGMLPLDPTLGAARKIAETEETVFEEVKRGGNIMYPIFAMAALALLIAVYKWLALTFIRRPSRRQMKDLYDAVRAKDADRAEAVALRMPGPVGAMLRTGVEHLDEPRELIEEVMYEHVMTAKMKLQRALPFIAISAASAPLLGLLGTVSGIINTFKMITVFGSGDVKSLSGGISEALITTKYGLIVAIPSLILHAFLSRKANGIVSRMESAAVALGNQVSLAQEKRPTAESTDAARESCGFDEDEIQARVNEAVFDLLRAAADRRGDAARTSIQHTAGR